MPRTSRPNIVFVLTDQQRFDTIAAMGHPHMETPNLDRLVNEGVSFSQTFCQNPQCVPARASLFEGTYVHTHGVYENEPWGGEHVWVPMMNDAGYATAGIGKMHTTPTRLTCGFRTRIYAENKESRGKPGDEDDWSLYLKENGLEKPGKQYLAQPDFKERLGAFEFPYGEEHMEDSFVAREAVSWLDEYEGGDPFFLYVGFIGPHDPFDAPKRIVDRYLEKDLPKPKRREGEQAEKPPEIYARRNLFQIADAEGNPTNATGIFWDDPSDEQIHRMMAHYLAGVTFVDEKVGELLEALERKGALDDTIIIFSSDHGEAMGDHFTMYKWFHFEGMVRVPLIAWAPGRFPARRCDAIVELFDIAPTILELAGVEPPERFQAESLVTLLEHDGEAAEVWSKEAAFSQDSLAAMVRTRTHKLVHYYDRPYGEFYELENDPGELYNKYDCPSDVGAFRRCYRLLTDYMTKGCPEPKHRRKEGRMGDVTP